jgi:hypothetical protein
MDEMDLMDECPLTAALSPDGGEGENYASSSSISSIVSISSISSIERASA